MKNANIKKSPQHFVANKLASKNQAHWFGTNTKALIPVPTDPVLSTAGLHQLLNTLCTSHYKVKYKHALISQEIKRLDPKKKTKNKRLQCYRAHLWRFRSKLSAMSSHNQMHTSGICEGSVTLQGDKLLRLPSRKLLQIRACSCLQPMIWQFKISVLINTVFSVVIVSPSQGTLKYFGVLPQLLLWTELGTASTDLPMLKLTEKHIKLCLR